MKTNWDANKVGYNVLLDAMLGAVDRAMTVVVDSAPYAAVFWAVYRAVRRAEGEAAHRTRSAHAVCNEPRHPALGDFLAAAGWGGAMKTNVSVGIAMYGAVYWAVSGAVGQAVSMDVVRNVNWAVDRAVGATMDRAMNRAMRGDPPHPAIVDFIAGTDQGAP